MILGRGWALVLLAVPAILLLLRIRAARPRAAEASSLLVWRKVSSSDTLARRPRPPLAAWLEAAGAALLVLALADPAIPGAAAGTVRVLLDTSASMHAKGADGRTRLEAARAALAGRETVLQEAARPEEVLPALLAAGRPVVVVTDRRLPGFEDDPPRLRTVGVGEPGFNAGFTVAAAEPSPGGGMRVFLSVEAWGGPGPVQGTIEGLGPGGGREVLTLSPGAARDFDRSIGTVDVVAIQFPGDVLSLDDRLMLKPFVEGPTPLARGDPRGPGEALLRALEAAGAGRAAGDGNPGEVVLLSSGEGTGVLAVLAFPVDASGGEVRGAEVVAAADPLARDVSVDPAVTLGTRGGPAPPGEVLLADGAGPLVTVERGDVLRVRFGFRPGGTWVERDPSFVILLKNIVDAVRAPARVEILSDYMELGRDPSVGPRETREAAAGESFGDLEAALREASLPDPAGRRPLAVMVLLGGAALLAGAWWTGR